MPETTLPHSYSISSLMNQSNNYRNNSHTSLNPSLKHLSESLTNLHLNHRNNNITNGIANNCYTASSNALNNNYLNTTNFNNTVNNNSPSLSHATSMSALNHLKRDDTSLTLPSIASKLATSVSSSISSNSHNSSYLTTTSAFTSKSTPVTTSTTSTSSVSSQTSTNTTTIISSNQSTPNKITSVVRPVINDTNRAIVTAHPVAPQIKPDANKYHSTLTSLEHNHSKPNVTIQVNPTLVTNTNSSDSSFIIPETRNHPAGLDFNDFLPKHIQQYGFDQQPFMSEIEAITSIIKGHKAAKTGLDYRRKQVQIVLAMWATKESKTALEYAVNLDEKSIIIDILNVMILKPYALHFLFSV